MHPSRLQPSSPPRATSPLFTTPPSFQSSLPSLPLFVVITAAGALLHFFPCLRAVEWRGVSTIQPPPPYSRQQPDHIVFQNPLCPFPARYCQPPPFLCPSFPWSPRRSPLTLLSFFQLLSCAPSLSSKSRCKARKYGIEEEASIRRRRKKKLLEDILAPFPF